MGFVSMLRRVCRDGRVVSSVSMLAREECTPPLPSTLLHTPSSSITVSPKSATFAS